MTDPFYADHWLTVYQGDCREVLAGLPAGSVHCVVTSPPYWGLRDYGTATWEGGDPGCDHRIGRTMGNANKGHVREVLDGDRDACRCGARRIDAQLGLEPTPDEYVANMVAVFREVRRVLRPDGTLWLNLGDSYAAGGTGGASSASTLASEVNARSVTKMQRMQSNGQSRSAPAGLKPKDLVGIPWRVAFALQADGWYLRSDIIWAKPNPMPESVTDRPTKAHEYLFLLSKSARYFYDVEAVKEDARTAEWPGIGPKHGESGQRLTSKDAPYLQGMTSHAGRNLRSVWTIATQPYPGAHFATFPPKLVEPCVKAGTSERGVCPECGAPWERVVETHRNGRDWNANNREGGPRLVKGQSASDGMPRDYRPPSTTGWQPTCAHGRCPVCDNTGDASTVGHLPGMQPDVRAKGPSSTGDILLEGVLGESERQEPEHDQGLRSERQGLHPPLPSESPDGDADGLRGRASPSDGGDAGPDTDARGSRRSHQRDQDGQSTIEPARDDQEGTRRPVQSRSGSDGDVPGLRTSVRAPGACRQCGADLQPLNPVPSTVLDCFAGSGTTGIVAQRLSRRAVLVDLSVDYLGQLMQRNDAVPMGL